MPQWSYFKKYILYQKLSSAFSQVPQNQMCLYLISILTNSLKNYNFDEETIMKKQSTDSQMKE